MKRVFEREFYVVQRLGSWGAWENVSPRYATPTKGFALLKERRREYREFKFRLARIDVTQTETYTDLGA